MAGRGLVELLSGQNTAGQGNRRTGGEVTSEDRGTVEGASVRIGNTHGGEGQIYLQHGAQARDRRPFRGGEIGGAIGVDNSH